MTQEQIDAHWARYQQHLNEIREMEQEGIELPMSAEQIYMIESRGDLVDLVTGEVIKRGASLGVTVTEKGRRMVQKARLAVKPATRP